MNDNNDYYNQGDILVVDLKPVKGHEEGKSRPCVVVSNNMYNKQFNSKIVVPISGSPKYLSGYYSASPFYITIPDNDAVHGTILLQHIR
ncbi:type II toxin-antitoxin system PemK/MazF family toxin, partial [Lactobacillus sp. XV13L]|nr:type II toxin-antitoxin system PemK/MazF family toxin [Lactobacillus sp. XV13L]